MKISSTFSTGCDWVVLIDREVASPLRRVVVVVLTYNCSLRPVPPFILLTHDMKVESEKIALKNGNELVSIRLWVYGM